MRYAIQIEDCKFRENTIYYRKSQEAAEQFALLALLLENYRREHSKPPIEPLNINFKIWQVED